MKNLALRTASFSLVLAIALTLGSGVARACSDLVIGAGWSCELTGEDSRYCYYSCECHGISEVTCANRLGLAGFELI